jgi:gas vesicle protein
MTNSTDPDEIREEIERTRADLSDNVNALADSVNPAHVAGRQVDKVKGAVFGVKDKVMGGRDDADDSSSVLGSAQSAVAGAPAQLQSQARGNPLAAGLIAFGVGLLAGSLLPTSTQEQQAASKVKGAATPLLSDAGKQVADNLKEPAQQAVEAVKGTATDAVSTVKDEGTSAAQDVKGQAQDAKDTVAQQ